jgi:LuxR family maltose regulon positive regulatory protein
MPVASKVLLGCPESGGGPQDAGAPQAITAAMPSQRASLSSPATAAPDSALAGAAPGTVLRREALAHIEAQAGARLVVVQGPAGFGKTTLLRQYAARRSAAGAALAWVRLDAQSVDPPQFLRQMMAALARGGRSTRPARAEARVPTVQDVARALERLAGPVLVVIDNFEQAFAEGLEGVFTQLLRALPEGMQLCIGTRVVPGGRLAGAALRGELVLVGEEQLRFGPAESAEFLGEFAQLSAQDVEQIHRGTDGWPAAMQYCRLGLQRGRRHRGPALAGRGISSELIDFLASEVFDCLEPALRELLLLLCLPEKLDAALVEALSGPCDGAARLREIERAGLFLGPVDAEGSWFRFHNLFRRFLLARLRRELAPAELCERNRRIAAWFAARGDAEDAIPHSLAAGDTEQAAALFAAVIDRLIAEERLGQVERYADELPAATLERHPELANAAIIAYGFRRAFDKANRLIEARERRLAAHPDPRHRALHDHARLFVLAAADDIEELGRVAQHTAGALAERDGFCYGVTCNARAMWLVGRGEFEQARELLRRARPLHDRDRSLFGQAYQEAVFALTLSAEGQIGAAAQRLAGALRRAEEQSGASATAGSVLAVYLADACYEQNRLAEAAALLRDYGPLAEEQAIVDPLAVLYLTQSRLALAAGRRGEAAELLERALYTGYRHDFRRLVHYARAEGVRQATLAGDLDLAGRRIRELGPREEDDGGLLFHAGECEAVTVTRARYLVHVGRSAEARSLLQAALRRARAQRRRRRELKLTLLLALAQHAEGRGNSARRSLQDALAIGLPREFVRSILDEGLPALALMRELQQSFAALPAHGAPGGDALPDYLRFLMAQAGAPGAAPGAPGAGADTARPPAAEQLTARERELLRHVAQGLSNESLAARLCLSTNTVKWHLRNIFAKLGIANRVQALAVARRLQIID